jgi:hypothetical protein
MRIRIKSSKNDPQKIEEEKTKNFMVLVCIAVFSLLRAESRKASFVAWTFFMKA